MEGKTIGIHEPVLPECKHTGGIARQHTEDTLGLTKFTPDKNGSISIATRVEKAKF